MSKLGARFLLLPLACLGALTLTYMWYSCTASQRQLVDCSSKVDTERQATTHVMPTNTHAVKETSSPAGNGVTQGLDDSVKKELIEGLLRLSAHAVRAGELRDVYQMRALGHQSHNEINRLLLSLGHTPHPDRPDKEGRDVCPEKYIHSNLLGGYPLWHKGFEMENCSGVPKFHTLLTLLYNFVRYSSEELLRVPEILRSVNKVYPELQVIAALPSSANLKSEDFKNVTFQKFDKEADTNIWNLLISKVKTKYVYIGRDVIRFSWFDRLERLVREINSINASVVASAYRTLQGGEWSHGCEQSILRSYSLVYRSGYDMSVEECLLCDHVHGPFVTKTALLKQHPLSPQMTATSGFAVWLLQIGKSGKKTVVCPDSMAFVTDQSRLPTTRQDWKDLAYHMQVEQVHINTTQVFEFSCDEANTGCSKVRRSGLVLSTCCKRELSDGIKLVMKKCEEAGLFCEIQDGTLLGALKFDSILPWELDADFRIHRNNITAFGERVKPYFIEQGFKVKSGSEGSQAYHKVYTPHSRWKIEGYEEPTMASEILIREGEISPTLVNLDGTYLRAIAESPGLYARNRFRYGLYQHVQHHIQLGEAAGWTFYEPKPFVKRPKPGHHSCLDQFAADGNMMYRYATP